MNASLRVLAFPNAPQEGVTSVATWADVPQPPTGSGDLYWVEGWRCGVVDLDLGEAAPAYFFAHHVCDEDGTLGNWEVVEDIYGHRCDIYGGMTVPSDWVRDGAVTVHADHVEVARYLYTVLDDTSERQVLYVELFEPPPAGTDAAYNVGVLTGTARGGADRIAGIKFHAHTSPIPLSLGRYGTDASLAGQANLLLEGGVPSHPVWALFDYSNPDALCVIADGQSPTEGVTSESGSLPSFTPPWFEAMGMNSAADPVGIKIKRALVIRRT